MAVGTRILLREPLFKLSAKRLATICKEAPMRGWRSVPVVAALVANPATFGLEAAAPRADAPVAAQRLTAESDGERFVGTYRLLRTETKDPSGKWTPTPNFNSIGYITYSDTGYMAVHIMPK